MNHTPKYVFADLIARCDGAAPFPYDELKEWEAAPLVGKKLGFIEENLKATHHTNNEIK